MSNRDKRWIKLALKIAENSNHVQHKMSAIVVRGGNVVAKGFNVVKSPHTDNKPNHAEARALRNKGDFRGCTIYIVRNNGKMSKPCPHCMARIKEAQISRMVYLDWNGDLQREYVL